MSDTTKPVVMFASIGDRDDILDQSQQETIEVFRKALADAADFFEKYSNMTDIEQRRIAEEKDQMIAVMKRHAASGIHQLPVCVLSCLA